MEKKESEEYRIEERAPALQFPYKVVEKQLEDKFLRFPERMRQLDQKIPFLKEIKRMPQYTKYLKTLFINKKQLEAKKIYLPKQVSVIIQATFPRKEKAIRPFMFPLKLGKIDAKGALSGLRDIPLLIYKHLLSS